MKFGFDKSINEKLSFLYETLFDDYDDIVSDDNSSIESLYDPETQFSELLQEWKKFGLFNEQYDYKLYIEMLKENAKINGNEIYIYALVLSFDNQEIFDKFLNSFENYTLNFNIKYLELDFTFHRRMKPKLHFSFNNIPDNLNITSLQVFGGIIDDLSGLNKDRLLRLSFNNSYVKTINGLGSNLQKLTFVYDTDIESVTDWSNLKNMNLLQLEVDYKRWEFIGIEHLLHFNNMPEEIINIPEVLFINHGAFGKLRYYKNYIKNMFINDNPQLKPKIRNLIINKLREIVSK